MPDAGPAPTLAAMTVLLAHQGGWDEILLVAGPILAIAGLLVLARKRAERGDSIAPGPAPGSADGDPLDVGTDGGEPTH